MVRRAVKLLLPHFREDSPVHRRVQFFCVVAICHIFGNLLLLPVVFFSAGMPNAIPTPISLSLVGMATVAIVFSVLLIRMQKRFAAMMVYLGGIYFTECFAAFVQPSVAMSLVTMGAMFVPVFIASLVLNSNESRWLALSVVAVSAILAWPALLIDPTMLSATFILQCVVAATIYINARMRDRDDGELERERQNVLRQSKLAGLGELAASITHEIRNPLSIMLASAELVELRNKRGEVQLGDSGKLVKSIRDSGLRINHIIEGLRKYSRGETGKVEISSLACLIEDTALMTNFKSKAAGVRFSIIGDFVGKTLNCNPVQIVQALTNLINNAIESVEGKDDRWVTLIISGTSEETSFRVIDSGTGIDVSRQSQLFEAFFTTKLQGTGLGLSVIKRIAESHEGSVQYELFEGNTSFVMRIPNAGPKRLQDLKDLPLAA